MKKKKKILIYLCGILLTVVFLFPIYILVINSFKPMKELYLNVLAFPTAETFTLDNYKKAFEQLDFLTSFANSLMITSIVTLCQIFISSMAAWVLVRRKCIMSTIVFMVITISMLIPFQCVMLPLLQMMGKLQMMNRTGLMIINMGFGTRMAVLLFHGFMNNVPQELEEAAAIDGCSSVKRFFMIVFPLLRGCIATVAILNVMALWNDYLLPSLVINKPGMQTLPLKTYMFFSEYLKRWDWGTAALVIVLIPIIIFYVFCQKYIIKGVTEGAVKG